MNYEDLQAVSVDRIAPALERIAAALEVIAGDITERKVRERAALVSQYRHLQRKCQEANNLFRSADNRAARLDPYAAGAEHKRVADWLQTCEERCAIADADLAAFIAAHPGIAELAGEA